MTREVVLEVEYAGQAKRPYGMTSIGFNVLTTLLRKNWDLTWNVVLETGGVLVSDEIEINIQLEFIMQAEPQLEIAMAKHRILNKPRAKNPGSQ